MAQTSEELTERTVVVYVIDGKKGQVRTLTNPHVLECYDEPKRPPIKGVVQRLDMSAHEAGAKLRVRGVVTADAIFGAEVAEHSMEDDAKDDVPRSGQWHERSREYVGQVRNRELYLHGYNIEGPSAVYTQPEMPPVTEMTQRLDLDAHEGQWIKLCAVFDRSDLWGAVLVGEVGDPSETAKERVLDANSSLKKATTRPYNGPEGARRVVLGLNMSDSSPLVFKFVLRELTSPEDYLLVFVQIPENEGVESKLLRKQRAEQWVADAKKQYVVVETFASCIDVKAALPAEVERIGAKIVVCGSQQGAPADSIFHPAFAEFCQKQCHQADGRPVRVRRVNMPNERHLAAQDAYIIDEL